MEPIDFIAIGFWIAGSVLAIAVALFLLKKYYDSDERNRVKLAFSLIFLTLGISRLLLMYFDYFLTGLNPALYTNYQFYWRIATLFQLIGLGFLILVSEYAVFQGKDYYLFFIGFLIILIVGMAVQDFVLSQNIVVYAVVFAAFIPISWIYLAWKLPLARKNTVLIIVGFLIFGFGLILLSINIVEMLAPIMDIHTDYLLAAIIQIPGLLLFAWGIKRYYFVS